MHCTSRRAPGRPSTRRLVALLATLAVATTMIAFGGPISPAGASVPRLTVVSN